ncbi:hypothetical protein CRU99_08105 [Malaciobacter mytili]|uniref:hypothetical protein n=1 Tax=Malaciobacter mytili TaxID=603050 RepID=UPI00100BE41C|nr:hypothetical protein [Malaciobacter mytili]RXI43314.1 hypothetical protein CRU99_08105 [Malaciobacter mytili]
MKKQENTKFQHIINQLLTLYFSGIYITNKDMLNLAQELGFDFPLKSREIMLKNLFLEAYNFQKIPKLCDSLIYLIDQRVQEYKKLSFEYPKINEVSSSWIFKANNIKRLLVNEKRGNIYE